MINMVFSIYSRLSLLFMSHIRCNPTSNRDGCMTLRVILPSRYFNLKLNISCSRLRLRTNLRHSCGEATVQERLVLAAAVAFRHLFELGWRTKWVLMSRNHGMCSVSTTQMFQLMFCLPRPPSTAAQFEDTGTSKTLLAEVDDQQTHKQMLGPLAEVVRWLESGAVDVAWEGCPAAVWKVKDAATSTRLQRQRTDWLITESVTQMMTGSEHSSWTFSRDICIAQLAERRSLAGELTLSCARPSEDGWPLCG